MAIEQGMMLTNKCASFQANIQRRSVVGVYTYVPWTEKENVQIMAYTDKAKVEYFKIICTFNIIIFCWMKNYFG